KNIDVDLLGEVGNETGAAVVARQPRILGDRLLRTRLGLGHRKPCPDTQNRKKNSPCGDGPQQGTERSHLPSPAAAQLWARQSFSTPGSEPGPTRFEPEIPYGYQNLKACWLSEACDPLGAI